MNIYSLKILTSVKKSGNISFMVSAIYLVCIVQITLFCPLSITDYYSKIPSKRDKIALSEIKTNFAFDKIVALLET